MASDQSFIDVIQLARQLRAKAQDACERAREAKAVAARLAGVPGAWPKFHDPAPQRADPKT